MFAVYPDAHQRNQADLDHVFSTSSSGGKQVIAKTVSTFKSLAEQAELAPIQEHTELQMTSGPLHTPAAPGANAAAAASSGTGPTGVALHIDIQIHISPEASADQIDQIFASMAKHLYGST